MTQLPPRILTWLADRQVRIEIILVVLIGLAGISKLLFLPGATEILMITMLTLGGFYFIMGFVPPTGNTLMLMPIRVFAISSAVCVIGLLFALLHLPGAQEQITIGLLSLAVSGLIILFLVIRSQTGNIIPMIIRLLVLGGLTLYAYVKLNPPTVH